MRTIYIDRDYCCHAEPGDGLRAVETDFFDGKCDALLTGYRFVPAGEEWVREDGTVFRGEMIAPWQEFSQLDALQRNYERQLLAEYAEALLLLGVAV